MQRCEALFRNTFDAYLPKNVTYCHNEGCFLRVSSINTHRNPLKVGIFGGKVWGVMDYALHKEYYGAGAPYVPGGFYKECRFNSSTGMKRHSFCFVH